MRRYKLVRVVDDGRFLSANTLNNPVEYKIGEVVEVGRKGIACYKKFRDVYKYTHLGETMNSFNDGRPVAILQVQSIGRVIYRDKRYRLRECYAGGVNYRGVRVIAVTRRIESLEGIK